MPLRVIIEKLALDFGLQAKKYRWEDTAKSLVNLFEEVVKNDKNK